MNVTVSPLIGDSTLIDSDCLIILLTPSASITWIDALEKNTKNYVESVISDEYFTAGKGQHLLLHRPFGFSAKRIYLCGLGRDPLTPDTLYKCLTKGFSQLCSITKSITHTHLLLNDGLLDDIQLQPRLSSNNLGSGNSRTSLRHDIAQLIRVIANSAYEANYRFHGYKTQRSHNSASTAFSRLCPMEIVVPQRYSDDDLIKQTLEQHCALNEGMTFAKDLAHMPANLCTPPYLAEQAYKLHKAFPAITTEVLSQETLRELGMHAYLAVNKGSSFEASMPIMHYNGGAVRINKKTNKPIVIIGKGVTFDSGGITLKRNPDMHHMIYDMAGAACVLGLMKTIASLKLSCDVIGILATAENSIDGTAYRPGDIIQTHAKKTVEIISTDAEGRMLLADAISYSRRYSPAAIIDIATLTGAAITTLGHQCSALFSNTASLTRQLVRSGEHSIDEVWPLPLWPEYYEAIESAHADMKNAGNGSPGAITAGCFISHFAGDTPWAHLDVAGTAFKYGTQLSATGRPIPLLLQYLMSYHS